MKVEYNNLYIHYFFSTIRRMTFKPLNHRERNEKYVNGIVKNSYSKFYSFYANPEHVHFLISKSPDFGENEFSENITDSNSKFSNDSSLCKGIFAWQQPCSAFSVSKTDVKKLCNYILNQPEHHKKHTFEEGK
jgi:putative transposase